jgi:hypothetical protein
MTVPGPSQQGSVSGLAVGLRQDARARTEVVVDGLRLGRWASKDVGYRSWPRVGSRICRGLEGGVVITGVVKTRSKLPHPDLG